MVCKKALSTSFNFVIKFLCPQFLAIIENGAYGWGGWRGLRGLEHQQKDGIRPSHRYEGFNRFFIRVRIVLLRGLCDRTNLTENSFLCPWVVRDNCFSMHAGFGTLLNPTPPLHAKWRHCYYISLWTVHAFGKPSHPYLLGCVQTKSMAPYLD